MTLTVLTRTRSKSLKKSTSSHETPSSSSEDLPIQPSPQNQDKSLNSENSEDASLLTFTQKWNDLPKFLNKRISKTETMFQKIHETLEKNVTIFSQNIVDQLFFENFDNDSLSFDNHYNDQQNPIEFTVDFDHPNHLSNCYPEEGKKEKNEKSTFKSIFFSDDGVWKVYWFKIISGMTMTCLQTLLKQINDQIVLHNQLSHPFFKFTVSALTKDKENDDSKEFLPLDDNIDYSVTTSFKIVIKIHYFNPHPLYQIRAVRDVEANSKIASFVGEKRKLFEIEPQSYISRFFKSKKSKSSMFDVAQ